MLQGSLAPGYKNTAFNALCVQKEKNMIVIIDGGHVTSPTRQFLHTSTYFRIRTAILRGNEKGNCTTRPILRAHFEVRSMDLASTL